MKSTPIVTPSQTMRLYWQSVRKYPSSVLRVYLLMPVAQILEETVAPLFIAAILNKLAAGSFSELTFDKIALPLLAIAAIELFCHFLWNYIVRVFWRFEEEVMRDLALRSTDHMTSMSYKFFSERFAGSLVNQINKFSHSFERLTDSLTWNVYKLIIGTVATCVVLLPKAPMVAVGIVVFATVYVPLIWTYRRRQLPLNKRWAQAETLRTGQYADSVSNILAVKAFANEKLERRLIKKRLGDVYDRSIDTMHMNMGQELVSGAVQRSLNVFVIIFSVWLATTKRIEVGVIYLSLEYTRSMLRRLWDLNDTFRNITRVFGDAYDMTAIMQITPGVKDAPVTEEPKISKGEITFKDVTFRYGEKDAKQGSLFEHLNLQIAPGEKVGLVGPSGGGKTTITSLMLRFMDIQDGAIEIDGQNIAHISQQDLRRHIAYVSQEPLLFHRSLTENIRYGRMSASDKDVKDAAKKANASEFIDRLAEGYETLVGERGVKLSGGQRQRVAIARAMIKDAPILILDEATSALDSESEHLIQQALWKLMEGRTAIVIAHRLSTIQHMDRIVVLDKGKIIEQGSHKDLLKKGGLYSELWAHQSGGFLED